MDTLAISRSKFGDATVSRDRWHGASVDQRLPNICLFQRDFMAQTTQTTQQQAAQQKEIARKLEEYIDKLDRVLI